MSSSMKHGKVTTYEQQDDNTTVIQTESYHEELASVKQEIEKRIKTSSSTLLADVVDCLNELRNKRTKNLVIEISSNQYYEPAIIVKRYVVKQEIYPRTSKIK